VKRARILLAIPLAAIGLATCNGIRIGRYASEYSEKTSDVAIVLGAGTDGKTVSPVFRGRLDHAIDLYRRGKARSILLTGGRAEGQLLSDSEIAGRYLLERGIPPGAILLERVSRYTVENLSESRRIMDSLGLRSALIVSDPLHMKRAMGLAEAMDLECEPSPTPTSAYRSFFPKARSLVYEVFFYSLGQVVGKN